MDEATVLVVEDEEKLSNLLIDYLRQEGYGVHSLARGDEVMPWLAQNSPDAILLDLMLPGVDGLTLCREIRQKSNVPILMLTARVEEIDRLLGLELGADDYICKPYSPREVMARVKAVLRRTLNVAATPESRVVLDDGRLELRYEGRAVQFTAVEYQLLSHLAQEPGRIFTRSQLMDGMYQDHRIVSERTIDSHIRKVRRKLETLQAPDELVQSVYGAGYRFEG
ncbi:MAG: two-component system response regulator BaeR [Halioglobus sp.]|jgi:two-component system response regulator BaeR